MNQPTLIATLLLSCSLVSTAAWGDSIDAWGDSIDPKPSEYGDSSVSQERVKVNDDLIWAAVIGRKDQEYWSFIELEMPEELLDFDGGSMRVIMQHELNPHDTVVVRDTTIGCEWPDETMGRKRNYPGIFCWTQPTGQPDRSFILGDTAHHDVWTPHHDWVRMTDYRWRADNKVLGGTKIRITVHPHVTARVLMFD